MPVGDTRIDGSARSASALAAGAFLPHERRRQGRYEARHPSLPGRDPADQTWTESRSAESQASFATALRLTRQRLGISQAHLGRLVGVGADTISNWERGRTYPELRRLRRVSIGLGWGDPLRWPSSAPPWKFIAPEIRPTSKATDRGFGS
jgi:DNA-binding XRE family transcriptional regulator